MIKKYTKQEFKAIEFDTKCVIMERLFPIDYFNGQTDINFHFEVDPLTSNLVPPCNEEEHREEKKFKELLRKLTEKLFGENNVIELDIEEVTK